MPKMAPDDVTFGVAHRPPPEEQQVVPIGQTLLPLPGRGGFIILVDKTFPDLYNGNLQIDPIFNHNGRQ